ncbi:hypothetical protein [Methylobacterium oxalidis]|uniref:hypothetical protein n=1 Tax=Methylobacterium oxalidis TaxID=944322 RepID=UPI0033160BD9
MTGVSFNWELNVGHLVTFGVFTVGAIGAWFTLRFRVDEAHKRATAAEAKADAASLALTEFKLEAARTFVQTGMLKEVKEDLSREIRDIEHVVRGALMSALGTLAPSRRPPRAD